MTEIFVDVEADGPYPPLYSMHEFGAVVINKDEDGNLSVEESFHGKLKPISPIYREDALAVSGWSRAETMKFDLPLMTMERFDTWLEDQERRGQGRLHFWSDNNGFDWSFINYYFWHFLNKNPFGHTSCNVSYLYKGVVQNTRENWARFRRKHASTKHDHNPVNDARANAEAYIYLKQKYKFK